VGFDTSLLQEAEIECVASAGSWQIAVTEDSLLRYRSEAQVEDIEPLGGEYEEFEAVALDTIAGVRLERQPNDQWQFVAALAILAVIAGGLSIGVNPLLALGLFALGVILGLVAYEMHDDGSAYLTIKTRRNLEGNDWQFQIDEIEADHEELVAMLTEQCGRQNIKAEVKRG